MDSCLIFLFKRKFNKKRGFGLWIEVKVLLLIISLKEKSKTLPRFKIVLHPIEFCGVKCSEHLMGYTINTGLTSDLSSLGSTALMSSSSPSEMYRCSTMNNVFAALSTSSLVSKSCPAPKRSYFFTR